MENLSNNNKERAILIRAIIEEKFKKLDKYRELDEYTRIAKLKFDKIDFKDYSQMSHDEKVDASKIIYNYSKANFDKNKAEKQYDEVNAIADEELARLAVAYKTRTLIRRLIKKLEAENANEKAVDTLKKKWSRLNDEIKPYSGSAKKMVSTIVKRKSFESTLEKYVERKAASIIV